MKRELFIEICAYALLVLFVYASINKLIAYNVFYNDLSRSPELGYFARFISIVIPVLELIVSAMLLFNSTKKVGFVGSAILMTTFTVYVGYVLSFTKDKPCSCGGIIRNLTWSQHFAFNIFFLLVAILGLTLLRRENSTSYA